MIVFFKARTFVFVFGLLLYFSTEHIRFNKIMDLSWKIYFGMILFSFLLYFLGFSDGGIARTYDVSRQAKAFGFTHPNVGGNWFMMMLLAKIYTDCSKKIRIFSIKGILCIIFYAIALSFTFVFFKCRTAVVVVIIEIVAMLFFKNCKYKNFFIKWLLLMIQPMILGFTIISAYLYPNYSTLRLDQILANRIFLCQFHMDENGLSFFGKSIDYAKYTLDNSYMSFLLQYGIVAMMIFIILGTIFINKAWSSKNGSIIAVAIALFAYGYMENGIFNFTINYAYLFLITGNSLLSSKCIGVDKEKEKEV